MLWTPLLVLLVFWVLGFFTNLLGFVHLAFVAAIVTLIVQLMARRKMTM